MSLFEQIVAAPLLRDSGELKAEYPVSIITLVQSLPRLPEWLKSHKHVRIANLFIADLAQGTPLSIHFPKTHGDPQIHCGIAALPAVEATPLVFYNTPEWLIRTLSMSFPQLASQKIWLVGDMDASLKRRNPIADFYDKNAEKLEKAYSILEPEARMVMAARVKALISGDPGYLPIASHAEYQHPFIRPQKGDCMIDGGISDMVQAQEGFAQAVGKDGQIYGFEPIGWMAEKAAAQLSSFPQYHLINSGLAEEDGKAEFSDMRDSSRLGRAPGANIIQCQLRSTDSFVQGNNIKKVDCLKLDIEGAELSALRGAKQTIIRDMPSLIICLYHKPRDIYEIPIYVHELVPEYKLYLAHSSAGFTDTILYAAVN